MAINCSPRELPLWSIEVGYGWSSLWPCRQVRHMWSRCSSRSLQLLSFCRSLASFWLQILIRALACSCFLPWRCQRVQRRQCLPGLPAGPGMGETCIIRYQQQFWLASGLSLASYCVTNYRLYMKRRKEYHQENEKTKRVIIRRFKKTKRVGIRSIINANFEENFKQILNSAPCRAFQEQTFEYTQPILSMARFHKTLRNVPDIIHRQVSATDQIKHYSVGRTPPWGMLFSTPGGVLNSTP